MNNKDYLSAAETAVLIRKALAKSFPGTKFYVRSETYSGGASIDVYYDGATLGPDGNPILVDVDYDGEPTGRPYEFPHSHGRAGHVPKPGTPKSRDVEAVAKAFQGSRFDGMIDLKYGVTHTIDEDGNVTGSASYGSGASQDGWSALGPGRTVHFGADWVFVRDELPYDVRQKAAVR